VLEGKKLLIEVSGLWHEYLDGRGKVYPALKGIDLCINDGEMVAIIGGNGSGKTTLARHMNALLLPTRGTVRVSGLDTRQKQNLRQIRSLVGMVFQNPEDQIVATTVEEDIAFGLENIALPRGEIRSRMESVLVQFDLLENRQRPPYLLSAGQKQRLALASVVAMQPETIIFDETTALLDPVGRQTVMRMMHNLHREGITVIFITHFMEEAAEAERVVVLNQGELVLDAPPRQVFRNKGLLAEVDLDMPITVRIGNRLRERFSDIYDTPLTKAELLEGLSKLGRVNAEKKARDNEGVKGKKESLISVVGLEHTYLEGSPLAHRALTGVDLTINQSEIYGFAGATGSGKSTLLQHLNGLLLPQKGKVRVGAFDLNDPAVDVRSLRRMAGMVFQTPDSQFFEQYVGDEIAFGPRLMGLTRPELRQRVQWAMEVVGLDFEAYKDRITFTLSGGEKRKVALASTLALKPQILLLDEPTGGLDPHWRKEALKLIGEFGKQGMTVVISSHHMEDLAKLVSKMTVLSHGKSAFVGDARSVLSQPEKLEEMGLLPPLAAEVSVELKRLDWELPDGIIDEDELVDGIFALTGSEKP
jgi:energy-coupling factor transporter ATPase